jgi:hypothetical protein
LEEEDGEFDDDRDEEDGECDTAYDSGESSAVISISRVQGRAGRL